MGTTTAIWKKPEFWMTLVTSLSGMLLAFGVITKEQADGLTTYIPNIVGAILSLLSTFKFVGVQHAAKVEVFRAMCALHVDRADKAEKTGKNGKAVAQSTVSPEQTVLNIARAAGL